MIALKHILVPTDFSETSEHAVKYGVALARLFHARLHLLHVSSKLTTDIAQDFPLGLATSLEDSIREEIHKILTPKEHAELTPEIAVRTGSPYLEIMRYAQKENIDLVVMGTHGRGFIGHIVMGSVAERVVRHGPCPVLTVRHPQHEFVLPDEGGEMAATKLSGV